MTLLRDKTGMRFWRLVVLRRGPNACRRLTAWICRCDCGGEATVTSSKLISGHTKSCGCLAREMATVLNASHGYTKGRTKARPLPPEDQAWCAAKRRCFTTSDQNFKHYGGRGIRMCDEWRHDYGRFFADMGPRPSPRHSLDRIDVNGDYKAANCRWATPREQAQNTTTNVRIHVAGELVVLKEAARRAGVSYLALYKAVVIRHEDPELVIARLCSKHSVFVERPQQSPSSRRLARAR